METKITSQSYLFNEKTAVFNDVDSEDIPDIIDVIKKHGPKKVELFANSITGDNFKLLCDTLEADDSMCWLELRSHNKVLKLEIKDEDSYFYLNPRILDKILYTVKHNLYIYQELDFMFSSEQRLNQILEHKEVAQLLKSIIPVSQSLPYSCAAFAIMGLMYKDSPDFNLFTELSIYKELWEAPGQMANPIKIKQFLEQNGYNVELIIQSDIANKLLESNDLLKAKFNFFKKTFDKAKIHEEGINENTFKLGSSQLPIVLSGRHLLFANRTENGILLCNPNTGKKRLFKCVTDFLNMPGEEPNLACSQFTGLSIGVSK
jgi:hypothetical protein